MSDQEILIRLTHVKKAFGPKVIYTDFNLDVRRGETLTLLGGSGTGKSVCLKLMTGLLHPDDGDVMVFDERCNDKTETEWVQIRRRVSMLFQSGALFDSLNVRENIAYPIRIHFPEKTEEEIDEIVAEKLELVGLDPIQSMKPADLSGGMRKRVGLARAIATNPDVILWDEPTTGLDPINISRINALIKRMQEKIGATSVVVTHEMSTAFDVSDRIAFLYDKQIVLCDTPDNIRNTNLEHVRNFIEGRFEAYND